MLHWRKHLSHWAAHVRSQHGRVPWGNMLLAVLSGPVPAQVWRSRIRTCAHCPVRSKEGWICQTTLANGDTVGCNCVIVFKALSAAPYPKGCFAYEVTGGQEGWPAHHFPNRRAKFAAVLRFLRP